MARTPAYWTNKNCRPSVQAVSQLSLSQAPHGFGTPYCGFPAFLSPLKTAKLRRLRFCKVNPVTIRSRRIRFEHAIVGQENFESGIKKLQIQKYPDHTSGLKIVETFEDEKTRPSTV